MALDIVLPMKIQRIDTVANPAPDGTDGFLHAQGYQAGYEEGRLRAEWECQRQYRNEQTRLVQTIKKLEMVYDHFQELVEAHLPELINASLRRIFRKHHFSAEEISAEIQALLGDLNQAGRLSIECAPAELESIKRQLEACDMMPEGTKWSLAANTALAHGEFLIKSDLGDVDGRHSTHIRQINLALDSSA